MTASNRANEVGNAIQEGIDCLFYLREQRADPPLVSATDLYGWCETLDRTQSTFAEIQMEIRAGKAWTSLHLSSDLVRSFADVRAHLSEIAPGAQLPAILFDLVEVACVEVAKSMRS